MEKVRKMLKCAGECNFLHFFASSFYKIWNDWEITELYFMAFFLLCFCVGHFVPMQRWWWKLIVNCATHRQRWQLERRTIKRQREEKKNAEKSWLCFFCPSILLLDVTSYSFPVRKDADIGLWKVHKHQEEASVIKLQLSWWLFERRVMEPFGTSSFYARRLKHHIIGQYKGITVARWPSYVLLYDCKLYLTIGKRLVTDWFHSSWSALISVPFLCVPVLIFYYFSLKG